ncbi:MAG: glycoside hydrolase, partial [Actinobacteria bacterium]|nr:glycoside hydrolase [Actinomycetota bacterium]
VVNPSHQALWDTQQSAGGCPDVSPVCIAEPQPPGAPQWTGGTNGVGFWASWDGGKSFPSSLAKNIGDGTGGWDSDVTVGSDGNVYVADLDVTDTAICTSTDRGRTFSSTGVAGDTCQTLALNRQGPETDRQWLTVGRHGELYLTYHDLAGGYPVMLVSKDKGKTFTPCGTIIDPLGVASDNYTPLGGTLVAKPVIGKDGTIYVTVTEPEIVSSVFSPVGSPLSQLYVAVLPQGACSPDAVFDNYKIYGNDDADFALFNSLAIDGSGVLYAVAAGATKSGQPTQNVWLFVSRNGGRTWGAPKTVNTSGLKTNMLPAIAGGVGKNQVAIGWYGSATTNDRNNERNQWRYYIATSLDGGKTFTQVAATSVLHYGAICDLGVFCDSGRNLADFSSIAVNPKTGVVIAAIPGDPWNRPASGVDDFGSQTYVVRQTGGYYLK